MHLFKIILFHLIWTGVGAFYYYYYFIYPQIPHTWHLYLYIVHKKMCEWKFATWAYFHKISCRFKPHYLTPESEKAHSMWEVCYYMYLEVFWKRILAKSRSLRRCGCQCERVHRIMRRERPNNALGWWCPSALSCSVF